MAILTRDQIRQADDLPCEEVEVPEWNGTVIVRAMSARRRDAYEIYLAEQKNDNGEIKIEDLRACVAVFSCEDGDGKLLFTTEDIPWLTMKSGKALDRVFAVARRLSLLGKEDLDETLGNSSGVRGDGSPIG